MNTKKIPVVQAVVTRCTKCGSTEHSKYNHKVVKNICGIGPDGKPYTHIVLRRTTCLTCGQNRVDRSLENRPKNKGLDE